MKMTARLTAACLLATSALCIAPASADELGDRGRQVFKKHQHSVVTVQLAMKTKMSFGGMGDRSNESRQDLTGTVVDPSGLTVLALSSCEPGDLVQNIMAGMSTEDMKIKMDTEITDLKILLDDGTELPADIVLRDKDLDLAFIRPKAKPASPMEAVDLTKSAPAQMLDQVFSLNRLGKAAGRAYSTSVERISAVVQKPRLFYVPDSAATMTGMGCPAFSADDKIVGIFVMRSVASGGSAGMSIFSGRSDAMTPIILPAQDVLKAAKQAPESKEKEMPKDEQK